MQLTSNSSQVPPLPICLSTRLYWPLGRCCWLKNKHQTSIDISLTASTDASDKMKSRNRTRSAQMIKFAFFLFTLRFQAWLTETVAVLRFRFPYLSLISEQVWITCVLRPPKIFSCTWKGSISLCLRSLIKHPNILREYMGFGLVWGWRFGQWQWRRRQVGSNESWENIVSANVITA